ncbi:hypothetical protein [Peribacillus deserti]|uniref:Uncharacterized protein n=1 Tax=Peribacillus deserti TaxID=673318 RepID=A0A2N5MB12_9BACI|nr:hypothetical protein [Peribacillus deserti]PLT31527.1 hypothetical protein CUU66_02020 [Peribacillus deserti]
MNRRDDENISEKQSAEGMMELFEIINAKGDSGELKNIVDDYNSRSQSDNSGSSHSSTQHDFASYQRPDPSQGPANEHNLVCNEELFYSDLRAIAEDSSKED